MKTLFTSIIFLLCFFLVCNTVTVKAQTIQQLVFNELWHQQSGTPDTVNWSASCLNGNNRLIVVGNTMTATQSTDMLLTKYNKDGTIDWQTTYNNAYDLQDYGIALTTDASNNIYVAATSFNDSANDYDYNILMYDDAGTLQWQTYYNGADSKYDVPTAIVIDDSGNVVVTGTSYSIADQFDFVTVKLDAAGNILWDKVFDYNGQNDIPVTLISVAPGFIEITGSAGVSLFDWDLVQVKIESNGTLWGASIDTTVGYGFDRPTAVAKDQAGNIYITGSAMNSGNYDIVLIKLDSALQEVWTQYFDYSGEADQGNDVKVFMNGEIYVTGYVTRSSGKKNGVFLKFDASGSLLYDNLESTADSSESESLKLAVQPFGQILTTGWKDGTVDKDIYISAFDADGNVTGYKENKGLFKGDDVPEYIGMVGDTIYLEAKVADSDTTFTYGVTQYTIDSIMNVLSPNGDTTGSVSFWENRGQIIDTDDSVRNDIKFYTNEGPSLYFSNEFYSYVLSRIDEDTTTDDTLERVDVSYDGGNRGVTTVSLDKQSSDYLNYFLAQCPEGIVNVSGYKKLVSRNIYDGIDAIYTWRKNNFDQRIVCKPGSDPTNVVINFAGADSVTVDTSGDLFVWTPIGIIRVPEPIAYEEDEYGTINTSLGWSTYFQLVSDTSVSFFVDAYDVSKSLVFEMSRDGGNQSLTNPGNLEWCTYFQAVGEDEPDDIKADASHNFFVSGITINAITPVSSGVTITSMAPSNTWSNAYVAKFSENNELKWITYYGGAGQETDVLNSENVIHEVFLCGRTASTDIPIEELTTTTYNYSTLTNVGSGGFLVKLSANGTNLLWGTYFPGVDYPIQMVVRNNINTSAIFIVGNINNSNNNFVMQTNGTAFQSIYGEAFITEFASDGTLIWGTLSECQSITGIALSQTTGAVYVVGGGYWYYDPQIPGWTCGPNQDFLLDANPGSSADYYQSSCDNSQDLVLMKFNNDLSLEWGTYFGGPYDDGSSSIAVDNSDNVYITGYIANSTPGNNPIPLYNTFSGNYQDIAIEDQYKMFIAEFDENCVPLYGTMFGNNDGSGNSFRCLVSHDDQVYYDGTTYEPLDCQDYSGYYFTDVAVPSALNPSVLNDMFYSSFDQEGHQVWTTFFGSDGGDEGKALYIDDKYLYSVGTSKSYINYLPVHNPGLPAYFQGVPIDAASNYDGFIAKFTLEPQINTATDDDYNKQESKSIYPNPSNDLFYLNLKNIQVNSIELTDVLGNKIQAPSSSVRNQQLMIDLSSYPSGIYFLSCSDDNDGSFTSKLVLCK